MHVREAAFLYFVIFEKVYWLIELGASIALSRYAKEVCDAIVAKCLTGRPKTVEKAQAAFLLWVELEAVEVFLVLNCIYSINLQSDEPIHLF